jgi:HK97 gp10 family phage protein
MTGLNVNKSGEDKIAEALNKKALRIVRQAKQLAPVDTGRLRSSITAELIRSGRKPKAVVGTNVEYAPFVEFGTSKQPAQPFLRPAARQVLDKNVTREDFR